MKKLLSLALLAASTFALAQSPQYAQLTVRGADWLCADGNGGFNFIGENNGISTGKLTSEALLDWGDYSSSGVLTQKYMYIDGYHSDTANFICAAVDATNHLIYAVFNVDNGPAGVSMNLYCLDPNTGSVVGSMVDSVSQQNEEVAVGPSGDVYTSYSTHGANGLSGPTTTFDFASRLASVRWYKTDNNVQTNGITAIGSTTDHVANWGNFANTVGMTPINRYDYLNSSGSFTVSDVFSGDQTYGGFAEAISDPTNNFTFATGDWPGALVNGEGDPVAFVAAYDANGTQYVGPDLPSEVRVNGSDNKAAAVGVACGTIGSYTTSPPSAVYNVCGCVGGFYSSWNIFGMEFYYNQQTGQYVLDQNTYTTASTPQYCSVCSADQKNDYFLAPAQDLMDAYLYTFAQGDLTNMTSSVDLTTLTNNQVYTHYYPAFMASSGTNLAPGAPQPVCVFGTTTVVANGGLNALLVMFTN